MRRLIALIATPFFALVFVSTVEAQDARKRQAAAEAYDRGTAAYLDGGYAEAAEWFETANRMAPAAPALMQAIRSHQRAESFTRAATLALRLSDLYPDEPAATQYASSVLADLSPRFVRVDASCTPECKLDLDGKLQEFHSFFLAPDSSHTLTASFETGSKTETVSGDAGQVLEMHFDAPPAPPKIVPSELESPGIDGSGRIDGDEKPLDPMFTFVGAGLTGALLIATIVSGIDANAGVDDYEKSARAARDCLPPGAASCAALRDDATRLLSDGEGRELRTNILIGATVAAGVGTALIALFFTDWSSDDTKDDEESMSLRIVPHWGGASGMLEGRF